MQKPLFNGRKGALDQMEKLVTALAGVAIVLAVVFLILAEVGTQQVSVEGINTSDVGTYTVGYNATLTTTSAIATVPTWLPIVVITVIGAALLGLVALFRRKTE